MARINNVAIVMLLALLLIIIAGCTPEQEAKARELIGQHRCAAFNGYICSAPDDCALPYLDTIESYCCPIKCGTCNQSCDDGNERTEDYCSTETNYECQHNYTYGYHFEKLGLMSCREDNKVKIIEFGQKGSMPTQFIEPLLVELRVH